MGYAANPEKNGEENPLGWFKFDDWTVTRLATQDEAGPVQVRACGVLSDGVHVWRLRI